jgi:Heterokaryon incompatibility protein (HET)
MKEIPFDQLSKAFQEAITVTRTMGIQYIWIDSLCIIQNSTKDWKEQFVTMGEVYSNSFCNVAATGAIDGGGGCFVNRNPAFIRSLTLQLPDLGTRNARLKEKPREALDGNRPKTDWEFLRFNIPDQGGEYTLLDMDLWRTEVDSSALCSRAWVPQERLLAPKMIHFGERQVFFESL